MSWGVLNAAMLVGLLGAAVPVVIHLINRSRDPIVDWGAMQFLELGRRARQELRLNELPVGSDGRNRCMLSAFGSKTSRNQPSNSKFIFGPSAWLR